MSEMPSNFSYLCRAFPYVCSEFPVLPIQPKGLLSFLSLLLFMCFTLPFFIFCFRASAFLGRCRCVPSFLSISSFLFRNFISGETRSLLFCNHCSLFFSVFGCDLCVASILSFSPYSGTFPNAQSLLKILLPSTKQASKAQILQTAKKVTIEELAFLDPNLYKNETFLCKESVKQYKLNLVLEDETNEMNALIIGTSGEKLFGTTCRDLVRVYPHTLGAISKDDRGKAFSRTLHMQYSLTWFLLSLYLSSAAWMTRGSTKGCIWLPLLRRFDQGHIQFLLNDKIMLVIVKKGLFPKSKKYFHHVLKQQKDYAVAS
ncbi:hypothetical protein DVH24_013709 [Malus domestica]|uniref:Uncharacterized protein n=1 Tax=Malus domestica TaxID=3750 RepID=A0A498JH45_MALDO|nr:hypothetical protein DVH24_013709 [Malus domestica]